MRDASVMPCVPYIGFSAALCGPGDGLIAALGADSRILT
jgi:hypothetical protein